MSLDFKNNIKNFKTTSLAICRRNLSRTMSWTVFPRIYTNLQSKVCFQFCFQVRWPLVSTIVFSSAFKFDGPQFQQQQIYICRLVRNEKSLPKYLIHKEFKMSVFFISEKTASKMNKFFNFLPYIQRAVISISQSQTY